MVGALVVGEQGGLGRVDPVTDGGASPTIAIDPFIRFSAVTGDAGVFELLVPPGSIGLHTLSPVFLEQMQTATAAGGAAPILVSPTPFSLLEAGVRSRPVASGLNANLGYEQLAFAPLTAITFAVNVAAGDATDPLSSDVFLVQPETGWAGALVPPTPAVPGGPYPDGVYNRVVEAPGVAGAYYYSVVAASVTGITSLPVSILITVTADGTPPIADGGDLDAYAFDGSGLPDGRY